MISDIDLQDWKPEDFTQPVGELDTYDVFTLLKYPSTKFRFISKNCFGDSVVQTMQDNVQDVKNYVLPSFLEIVKWSK
jgi:hypothetical protein